MRLSLLEAFTMNRIFRALDVLLGMSLAAALALCVLTALPSKARAADIAFGSGQASTERREASDFTGIAVSGSFDVLVRQDGRESVAVRADANLLPLIETVVDGKTLQIRWKRSSWVHTKTPPTIEVSVKQLQSLASSGASDLRVEGVKTPQLAVSISGSGDIRLNALSSEQLSVAIAGSGDVTASGQTSRLQVKISGSGNVGTEGLRADDVSVSIAGSGDAAVQADKSLTVSIAGSGDVVYSGAATVKSSVAGSGSVRKR
jgi:hypothetical protein